MLPAKKSKTKQNSTIEQIQQKELQTSVENVVKPTQTAEIKKLEKQLGFFSKWWLNGRT